jgi:PAS domain S-box-containing protein
MFDWRAMQRFGIREKDLPPGSQIFSKPFSFYEQYRMWIWIGLAVFLIQSWLLVVLLINRARRLKGEKSLRESEERYKELYEDAPVAYHEYDQEGRIVRVNKKELEMLGYTPEELIGKYVWDFVIEKEEAEKSIKGRIAGYVPPAKGLERTYRRKDGKTVPVLIDEATLKEEAGRIIGVRSAIQDITELKRAEEKIIASLKEKEVLLKEIHHRVRNNLTTIVSILSLQAPYLEDRKSQEIFRECENRVRTMSKIHTKLYQSKDLAHIDFGSYLRELSSELFMSYQVNPEAIDLEIDVDDIELDINAALPLGLLLTELITNSLKYAFPGGRKGRLQVNLQKVVDRMVLSVADDGIGFPEHLDYQNTTSLGLQLVMGLVRQLDGTIDMKREQGTAFNITFPEAK